MNENLVTKTKGRPAGEALPNEQSLPQISPLLLRWFLGYAGRYLRRHFHSVRLLRGGAPSVPDGLPFVVYFNHSSWWDPLLTLLLAREFFPAHAAHGPIDRAALERYRFFRRLGFFGVDASPAGAKAFVKIASALLADPAKSLWISPQAEFKDVRSRPLHFRRGLSHLAARAPRAAFVPLAIEYVFWEERFPEILLSFGEPLIFERAHHLPLHETTSLFELALSSVQDQLSAAAQRREPNEWKMLRRGGSGIGGFYDLWRRGRARLRGEKFRPAHSDL